MARQYVQRAYAWVQDFLRGYFPRVRAWEEQGAIYDVRGTEISPDPDTVRFYGRLMPRFDLLFEDPGRGWVLVEFKRKATPREVANLKFYEDALRHDVTRPALATAPIRRVFVADEDNPLVRAACDRDGVELVVLNPPF